MNGITALRGVRFGELVDGEGFEFLLYVLAELLYVCFVHHGVVTVVLDHHVGVERERAVVDGRLVVHPFGRHFVPRGNMLIV